MLIINPTDSPDLHIELNLIDKSRDYAQKSEINSLLKLVCKRILQAKAYIHTENYDVSVCVFKKKKVFHC